MSKDYKFTPIILVKDKDGKIEITEEKLKEMLKDAYNNGFEDGKNSQAVIVPTYPTLPLTTPISPTIPQPYWGDKFYCTDVGTNTEMPKPSVFWNGKGVQVEGKA